MQRTEPSVTLDGSAAVSCRLLEEWADLEAASAVVLAVWGESATSLASPHLLRAYAHFGNPIIGAYADERLCGVSIGFLAPSHGVHLHSHITGVIPPYQHLGVGLGLKAAQRRWCLEQGVDLITWTFDPLVARNAYFNMRKLGAVSRRFLPDFYGRMDDNFNHGDETDRLEVRWPITSPGVEEALAAAGGLTSGTPPVDAGRDTERRPIVRTVEVPEDYHRLRRDDPVAARAWRTSVREQLTAAFAEGLEVVDFTREAGYGLAPASDA